MDERRILKDKRERAACLIGFPEREAREGGTIYEVKLA